jgi:uncharacterized protein YcnI
MSFKTEPWLLMIGLLVAASSANAHATLDRSEAPANSFFNLNISVTHGCEGSPTLKVRVHVPEGVTSVKPQPKPGWRVSLQRRKLTAPITDAHGGTITEIVDEVIWEGRLEDEHYDQFGIHMKLPNTPGKTIYFPVVQECEKGVHRWIEVPEKGKTSRDYREPAPALLLTPNRGQPR